MTLDLSNSQTGRCFAATSADLLEVVLLVELDQEIRIEVMRLEELIELFLTERFPELDEEGHDGPDFRAPRERELLGKAESALLFSLAEPGRGQTLQVAE